MEIYCPSCRAYGETESVPPYSAVHVLSDPPQHRHPITGEIIVIEETT